MKIRTLVILSTIALLSACAERSDVYPGYVEGEYLHIAVPSGGTLMRLDVARGDQLVSGQALFEVDRSRQLTALSRAQHQFTRAEAAYQDLSKGKRSEELDVIRAQRRQAQTQADLAATQNQRVLKLFREGNVSAAQRDDAQARVEQTQARLTELDAALASAELSARSDALAAARQDILIAQAGVDDAQWALDQNAPTAPEDALVHDTYFQPGEWVPAGAPVVSLLPPSNRKLRFFVPEPVVSRLRVGQSVTIACDGCDTSLSGEISHIAAQAEFTPPVIYSKDQRAKLVFRIEARLPPDEAAKLAPGLPIEVQLSSAQP